VPGPGITAVPIAEPTDRELPVHPAETVGIKADLVGYHVILFAPGMDRNTARLESASLSHGGVEQPVKIAGGGVNGRILVPPGPLLPNTRYDVNAVWRDAAGAVTQRFSFTTGVADATIRAALRNALSLSARVRRTGGTRLRLELRAASTATNLVVALRGSHGALALAKNRGGGAGKRFSRRLPRAGRYRACAASGGGGTARQPRQQCLSLTITRRGRLRVHKARPWCPAFGTEAACRGTLDRLSPRPPAPGAKK
jgi:hypothetical protein